MRTCKGCKTEKPSGSFSIIVRNIVKPNGKAYRYEYFNPKCHTCNSRRRRELDREKAALDGKSLSAWNKDKYESVRMASVLSSTRSRAKKKGLVFALRPDDIRKLLDDQNWKCPFTGWAFQMPYEGPTSPNTMSIDRKDRSEGYTVDNIRLVAYQVNIAMNIWGEESLSHFAKSIMEQNVG